MPEGRDRTAQEREAARLEREAARLERERRRAGRPAASAPPSPRSSPAPRSSLPPTALDDEAPPVDDRAAAPVDDRALPADDRALPLDGHDLLDEEPEPLEEASGTRRVSRLERMRAGGGAAAGRRRSRRLPRAARGHSRGGRIVALVAIVLGLAALWFLDQLFQPFQGSGHGSVTVTIPPHSSSSTVGSLLERDGVISSSFFFELRATLAGDRSALRSGTYQLELDMGYGDVLKILTTPPPAVPTTQVTIIPGRTRRQIDRLLRSQGVAGSYLGDTRRSKIVNPLSFGAPRGTDNLEGFLFPDTYSLAKPIRITHLVADQLRRFKQEFASVGLGYARSQHLSAYDVLIIGSMVEAESASAHDRPLIASVIYNRLRLGMPLQIDATTRYATGNYTSPLTQSQLNSSSPYNTRIHKGLPPTPIDNPALASIQAAAHPAITNFLYFVVKPCGNGAQTFTGDYNQFLQLVQQYQNARAKRGGRSPAQC